MYHVLEAEMAYHGVTKHGLADGIGMKYNTLLAKINGKSPFSFDEAVRIQTFLDTDMPIENLFSKKFEKNKTDSR